jgi:hypothetical protein
MINNIGINEIKLFLLVVVSVTMLMKLFFYLRIREDKKVSEFIIDIFFYANKMILNNLTIDDDRMQYLKVKNYCIIVFWSCLLLLLVIYAKS